MRATYTVMFINLYYYRELDNATCPYFIYYKKITIQSSGKM